MAKDKNFEKFDYKKIRESSNKDKIRPLPPRVVIGESIKTALELNRSKFSAISEQVRVSTSALYNYGSKETSMASREKLMLIASILDYTYEEDWDDRARKVGRKYVGGVVAEFKEMKHIDLYESLMDMNPKLRDMPIEERQAMSVDEMVRMAIQPELRKRLARRTLIRSSVMAEGEMKAKAKEDHMIPILKDVTLVGESWSTLPTEQTQMYMIPPVRLRGTERLFG